MSQRFSLIDDNRCIGDIGATMSVQAMTPAQSRAARGLLGISQAELADKADLGLSTVRDFETERREVATETVALIRRTLEAAGVEFIPENGGGAGVRFAKRAKGRAKR